MSSSALPEGWSKVSLNEIGEWVGGGTPSKAHAGFWQGTIPWVSPKDMKAHSIVDTEDHISSEAIQQSAAKLIPRGAVLFVTRSGILAHSFPVATTKVEVTVNQDLKAIVPSSGIEAEYLAWSLRAYAREILSGCSKDGTTVHSIETSMLKDFVVPIPPAGEQSRIVTKIETLFSELDKGIDALKVVCKLLKAYRQAVLKHAFEGKLTTRWREENREKLCSQAELRLHIKNKREAAYQDLLEEWKKAIRTWESNGQKGRKPPKPHAPSSATALPAEVLADLPVLPQSWVWERLGWMTLGVEYGTAAKSAQQGTTPVVRMGNLQNGSIDWGDLVFTSDEAEIEKYSLSSGDVLFNRTNSPELVGKTAIYRGERPAVFAGYLIRVNHIHSIVDSQYLNLFLNSPIAARYGNSVKTDGVNQSNINGEKLQGYPFPFCSLAEQKAIVEIVDAKLTLANRLLEEVDSQLGKAEALRQSILKRAFSGQLVPQDPNDEPASVLLERIHAEKAAGERSTKPKTSRKNKSKESA